MTRNEWKTIWGKRTADEKILKTKDKKQIFLELKRSNGFDVVEDGLTYESFDEQKNNMVNWLSGKGKQKIESIYEVGCGSGANLFLFEQDGIACGGLDYSEALIESAKKFYNRKIYFVRKQLIIQLLRSMMQYYLMVYSIILWMNNMRMRY